MKASRTLTRTNLRAFASYCKQRGWAVVPVKGKYEVLRMQPTIGSSNSGRAGGSNNPASGSGLLLVHKNDYDHNLAVQGVGDEFIKDFLRTRGYKFGEQQELL